MFQKQRISYMITVKVTKLLLGQFLVEEIYVKNRNKKQIIQLLIIIDEYKVKGLDIYATNKINVSKIKNLDIYIMILKVTRLLLLEQVWET